MLLRKSNAVSAVCIAAIILLVMAPMGTYAITTPAGIVTHPPHVQVILKVQVLVNKESVTTAGANLSLIMLLAGSPDKLNGTVVINRNGNSPISNAPSEPGKPAPVGACTAIVKGSIFSRNSTSPSNTFNDVFVVVTGIEPPDPCIAGLQGYSLVIQWQVFNGTVRLTATPPTTTSAVAQTPLQWNGLPAPGSEIYLIVQSSSAASTQPT